MNDAQIMAFLTVADTLNFTRAANQLHLTQQAVSKYVNEMERSFNLVLFERTKTAVRLTPEGETLSRLFREYAYDQHKVREKIDNYYRQLEFKFKIGISETIEPFGEIWGGVDAFISEHPNTVFYGGQFMIYKLQDDLDSGKYDVALVSKTNIPLGDEYEVQPVAKERLCLYGPASLCSDGFDNGCWGLVMLQQASWEWGYLAWNRIGPTRLAKMDLHPERCLGVPNAASLAAEMRLDRFVTVADDRFGYIGKLPGLAKYPLEEPGELCCVWKKSNENPLLPKFAGKLKAFHEKAN